ncbi:MAG TPA: hypothetical protein VGO52_25115 [Hyphomonadaceae bacterium]|jgi:hypothetical protein|nr:hypothetical protein [Hyphomonadaceae bacterium]
MRNHTNPDHPEDDAVNGAPPPNDPSLLDPATWRLFAWVRSFVRSVLETDYENLWPGNLLRGETIWQWARYEMLDWLHPIEKLLRRILLIEAYALIETQSLPLARPGREAAKGIQPEASPELPNTSPAKTCGQARPQTR